MRIVFAVGGVLALVASLGSCVMAKTVIHETAGLVLALVGVVGLGVAAVLEELQQLKRAVVEQFGYLAQFLRDQRNQP